MRSKPVGKSLAAFLALLVFIQSSVLSYAAETNFWKERARQTHSEPIQLASLPLPDLTSPKYDVLSSKQVLTSKLELKNYLGLKTSNLDFLAGLPTSYGTIRKIILPEN